LTVFSEGVATIQLLRFHAAGLLDGCFEQELAHAFFTMTAANVHELQLELVSGFSHKPAFQDRYADQLRALKGSEKGPAPVEAVQRNESVLLDY
jgi:hypothetical protein